MNDLIAKIDGRWPYALLGDALLVQGDCLEVLPMLEAGSVDAVVTDLPYGTTSSKWDSVIPFKAMWSDWHRVSAPNAAMITTASQPFTSAIVMSNPAEFRHEWIWIKNAGSNFANTCREPMKEHESVLVFSRGKWTYNKQMQERTGGGAERAKYAVKFNDQDREGTRKFEGREHHDMPELRVPSSWQKFNRERGLHPNHKPVPLFTYILLTYSNELDVVLDPCFGSCTTAVAALRCKRRFIGVENDPKYFATAVARLEGELKKSPTVVQRTLLGEA